MAEICTLPGCEHECEPPHVFCDSHWPMLPPKLQRELWRVHRSPAHFGPAARMTVTLRALDALKLAEARSGSRMFPPGAPLSPSGRVVMGWCGRRAVQLGSRKGHCQWCDGPVVAPRRKWCSAACVEEMNRRDPNVLRGRVLRRDRGKPCPLCGSERFSPEVDHTVPIIEGGDPFDPANLRTLCGTCHKRETKALAARRAAQVRELRDAVAPQLTLGGLT